MGLGVADAIRNSVTVVSNESTSPDSADQYLKNLEEFQTVSALRRLTQTCSTVTVDLPGGVETFENNDHIFSYMDVVSPCGLCGLQLPYHLMDSHMSHAHGNVNGKAQCAICFRYFKNKNSLKVHKSTKHRMFSKTFVVSPPNTNDNSTGPESSWNSQQLEISNQDNSNFKSELEMF